MYIVFEPDDLEECPKCQGHGEVKLALHVGKTVDTNIKTIRCGECDGVGMVPLDLDFEIELKADNDK